MNYEKMWRDLDYSLNKAIKDLNIKVEESVNTEHTKYADRLAALCAMSLVMQLIEVNEGL